MVYELLNGTFFQLPLEFVASQDINYVAWVLWAVYPIIVSFIAPFLLLVLIYASSLFLMIYRHQHWLRGLELNWNGARQILATLWVSHGRLWHGYELHGMENLPQTGPAIIIYYHGALPIDNYYLISRVFLEQRRQMRCVGDEFLFLIPGWQQLLRVLHVIPGTVQTCVDILRDGHILSISPGGVREALFGDEYYRLLWGQRKGFAKVALQANATLNTPVPVIPMFTENLREAVRTPYLLRRLLKKFYEYSRLPIVPMYGLFPVKLRTYLGKPIYPDPNSSVDEFAARVKASVEELIHQHQRIPGNILAALLERVR